MPVTHVANWFAGWALILGAFVTGAGIGLFFHRADFWGGYASFRRRIVRLGHVALAALGIINLLYAFSPWPAPDTSPGAWASRLWILGGVTMPLVCFLTAWRERFRHLFVIPVLSLVAAAMFTLWGGR